jgi:cytoskeleton protein RodZ
MSTEDGYNDIGLLLQKARQEKHMALEYVAQTLHIRVRYLDALESGRLNDLPGLSYTKGYLQVYAGFLGLDKEELLRRFEEVEEQLTRRGFYFPQVFNKEKTPANIVIWGGLAGALVIYILWLAFQPTRMPISLVEQFPQEHKAESQSPAQDAPCLATHPVLYPPCTMPRHTWASLVSLQAQTKVTVAPAFGQTTEK